MKNQKIVNCLKLFPALSCDFLKFVIYMGLFFPGYFRLGHRAVTLLTQMKLLSISQDSYEVRPFARGHIRIKADDSETRKALK